VWKVGYIYEAVLLHRKLVFKIQKLQRWQRSTWDWKRKKLKQGIFSQVFT
jgi:hypothetical protein